jgi:hypothetical protein
MRRLVSAVTVALALLWLAAPAFAEVQPPAGPSLPDLSHLGQDITTSLLHGWQEWLDTYLAGTGPMVVLHAILRAIGTVGQGLLTNMGDASRAGGEDMLTHLSPSITVDDATVRNGYETARTVFNGIIACGLTYLGFRALVGGLSFKDIGLLLPRVGIAFIGINAARDILRESAVASNGLADFLSGGGAQSFTERVAHAATPEEAGGALLVMGVMAALLFVQRAMMHGLLGLLVVMAPLAIAAWAIPQWSGRFWQWLTLVGGILLTNVLQGMALATGASMLAAAMARASGGGSGGGPASGNAAGLLTAVIALAFIGLAIGIPAILGLGLLGGSLVGHARALAMTAHTMRLKTRPAVAPTAAASGAAGGTDAGGEAAGDDGWDYSYGGELGAPVITPRQVTVQTLPPLPAPDPSAATWQRRQLPPPDYTKE